MKTIYVNHDRTGIKCHNIDSTFACGMDTTYSATRTAKWGLMMWAFCSKDSGFIINDDMSLKIKLIKGDEDAN